jgi:membrane protein DedA with SNARE-associated domain
MITELLLGIVLGIINSIGYIGVFLLMAAESTLLPVPSELVLPFAGYQIANGSFGLIEVIIAGTIGTIIGALISYYIGKHIGRTIITKYGKYFLVREHELDLAHKWFEKHGEKTIFICRFIPAVRHVISLPAGTAKMNLKKFVAYTALGGLIWNCFLIWAGIQLQQNWNVVVKYGEQLDVVVITLVIIGLIWFIATRIKRKK